MSLATRWKGARGEWYVVAQMVLIALVFFGPRTWWGWRTWVFPYTLLGSIGGSALLLVGILLLAAAIFRLGIRPRGAASCAKLHSAHLDFNDDALPFGIMMLCRIAETFLSGT